MTKVQIFLLLPLSSKFNIENSGLWSFWLHAMYACTKQYPTYQTRWEN